jgi:hypothetical protein
MTITASRLSDTEVLVDHTVYTFSDSVVADAFQRCIGQDSVDSCSTSHVAGVVAHSERCRPGRPSAR